MTALVVDASVAIKWVIAETDSAAALGLLGGDLSAPDLLAAECANILRKKVRRREVTEAEALMAARLLEAAEIDLVPTRRLLERATRLAIGLGHPAYDCVYLALAETTDSDFVTADQRLCAKVRAASYPGRVVWLGDMAGAADLRPLTP